jgi:hypothetical protein
MRSYPMHSIADSSLGLEVSSHFNLDGHGHFQVSSATRRFGFEITVNEMSGQPSVIFGISRADGEKSDVRFAVRLDLATGQLWDAAHERGLIGVLDTTPYPGREELGRISLRWQVERAGNALIPRLHVGGEEFLYPAVRLLEDAPFVAFVGHDALELEGSAIFSPSHVWCLDGIA